MSLITAITELVPGIDFSKDVIVKDDGTGPFIAQWNRQDIAQPTQEQIESIMPLAQFSLAKHRLSAIRYEKETAGFTIEEQLISSHRDEIGHWYPRFASAYGYLTNDAMAVAANPTGQYPYKPRGGDPVVLTASQAVRAYQCLSWYINMCFAVEVQGVAMLEAGMTIEQVMAALQWPQREFMWEAPE